MRILCSQVLFVLLLSLCDGQQFMQRNMEVPGFSCLPLSTFVYGCNLCNCNLFGSSAQCRSIECPEIRPQKRPEKTKLCTPGQKQKVKEDCNECVCTASMLWACTKMDCKKQGNANGVIKKSKLYSYSCYKTSQQSFKVCESRTQSCGIFEMNINHQYFFAPRIITIRSFCMVPVCRIVTVVRREKYVCPEVEDTLELDESDAEENPDSTTISSKPDDSTVSEIETTPKPIETSPQDIVSYSTATSTSTSTSTSTTTTTSKPEDIDASVEIVTAPENEDVGSEDTTRKPEIEVTDDSGEVPKEKIEESGDSFTAEQFDRDDFQCIPNKSFKLECNTCWCKSDGLGARYCTRIACKPKVYKPLNQQ